MIGAPNVYAQTIYNATISKHPEQDILSGLEHGKADASITCEHFYKCNNWILMRGHGFINQTQEFIRGYIHGFCSNPEFAGGGGSEAEQADFNCDDGPNGVRYALPGSLDDNNTAYVTPYPGPGMIRAQSAYASVLPPTFYQNMSGFEHGVHDAFLTNQNLTTYISEPGHGMENHTQVFNDGYSKGWCSVMGGNHGIEEPYAEFDCTDQP
jgi:hypothetical protein